MQTHLYGFVVVAFFDDVRVCYNCLEPEGVLEFLRRNRLNARINYGEQQRGFHCAAFGFQFSDSAKQIFFFNFKAQDET